jgi:glutamate--cysteine ligase
MVSQRIPFFRFTMNQSLAHKGYFDEHPLRDRTLAEYQAEAAASLAQQRLIEAADTVGFDDFLKSYLAMD